MGQTPMPLKDSRALRKTFVKLYLVRHAEAVDKSTDAARPLTRKGRRDAAKLGRHLRSLGLELPAIWHSKKPRAIETAEELVAAFRVRPKLTERAGLTPMASVKPIAKLLEMRSKDLMIVGHEPFLSTLASYLFTGKKSLCRLELGKPSVVCLQHDAGDGKAWTLLWMLPGPVAQD